MEFNLIENKKILIRTRGRLCETPEELIQSELFITIIERALKKLALQKSPLIHLLDMEAEESPEALRTLLWKLQHNAITEVRKTEKKCRKILNNPKDLNQLVDYFYNFWREYERFVVCDTIHDNLDKRPYRTFNQTVEQLAHLVRMVYRDISENILQQHPVIYRQVNSGAEFACISKTIDNPAFEHYPELQDLQFISQVYLAPPMILEPTMNKRKGKFKESREQLMDYFNLQKEEWLCYPAIVGDLIIWVYFHQKFFELGFALANLFELAREKDLKKKPDAIYFFGVPGDELYQLDEMPTLFNLENESGIPHAVCPGSDEFGYFGYLKKMILTLHNALKIRQGHLPFHGSFVQISLQNGKSSNILMIGDSGAGKSETLEAYKAIGEKEISDIRIIADDMGSIEMRDGTMVAYGTETGAFLRLDDLKPGYAFGQIDRSILMSVNEKNARIVLPVTSLQTVQEGIPIDYLLYANNYEQIDEDHPAIEQFNSKKEALETFARGRVMSKGTTNTKGVVENYFANIFGPPQLKKEHDKLAERYFDLFFQKKLFIGQIRTQLGIEGKEQSGPEEAAKALLAIF